MKNNLLSLLIIVTGLMACNRIPSNVPDLMTHYKENAIDELESPLSGAVLVIKDDTVLYKESTGLANRKENVNIGPDTRFYIGGMTQQFTACLVLQLAQEELLNLEDPISVYLPEFPQGKGDSITIHQLLSHTSGLPTSSALRSLGYNRNDFYRTPISLDDYVDLIGQMELSFVPGTRYAYSLFGYILLGAVIEKVRQQSFAQALETSIVQPLRLTGTGYDEEPLESGYAEDYEYESGNMLSEEGYQKHRSEELSTAFSASGMYSTLNDLEKWSSSLQNNTLLTPPYQKKLYEPFLKGACYGHFRNPQKMLEDDLDAQLYYREGSIMGYTSLLAQYDDGVTIIGLFNTNPLENLPRFTNQLHLAALGKNKRAKPFSHPSTYSLDHFNNGGGMPAFTHYYDEISRRAGYPIRPTERTLRRIMNMHLSDNQQEVVINYINDFIDNHPDLPEALINTIGYRFMEYRMYDEAKTVFAENVRRFPNSANCYDSLGDAYRRNDQLEEAKAQYLKAIETAIRTNDNNIEGYERNLRRVEKAMEGDL